MENTLKASQIFPLVGVLVGCGPQMEGTLFPQSNENEPGALSLDTGELDTGEVDLPSVAFATLLSACAETLDEFACPGNDAEDGLDSGCVAGMGTRRAALEAKILEQAAAVSGEEGLTMAELYDLDAPKTAYAWTELGRFDADGFPTWYRSAFLDLSFGAHKSLYNGVSSPNDLVAQDRLRCWAMDVSLSQVEDPRAAVWTPVVAKNSWVNPDGSSLESADLIVNTNDMSHSDSLNVNGHYFPWLDPNLNFTYGLETLSDSNAAVFRAVESFTGPMSGVGSAHRAAVL